MARFCLDEGTSGRKRRKRGSEEDENLRKKTCDRGEGECSEAEEEESSDEVGDEVDETAEDGGFRRGNNNKNGEFNFRIDPEVLDCSICFEPLRPPIFQCRNGHIACYICCPKLLNKCHVCSQPIGNRRCIALEKVIESMLSPCKYANLGCRAVLSFAVKADHEECCGHAALFCPISNCTFSGSRNLLFAHAKRKHGNISMNFSYNLSFMIALEKHQRCMILLGEDGHFFLLMNCHETFLGNILSVICMASSSPESDEFSYELRVDGGGSSLRFRASAQNMRKWNGVQSSKTLLVVPDDFFASSSQLVISARIYKSIGVVK
ncbi:putative E3 ubiquitin-protein ligase SINA-like 6 [Phalaenopsis equestris]|uniref:putative E3 ubiquitin-protein ligase SINA-like 6 n=1 Tax=Phalaenopsis equestris TaxID=78828 RepID=UPI0009E3FE2E|nr:putative E3 ubiquitin-protein ligase SINA-like 6 [Phalaenopsis equestris]XP_020588580.1 putative E3 ubiquitin-protein ligase SINA-like 6 [Phalaenopsis equestris]XP_020588589.1 putative E3 ubiquitin-protein ligase SINA-like 6 [Phalaenopsis equestris]